MNPNELIQHYLHGEATDAEVAELDRLLASDRALRRKLIVETGIDAGLCEIARERASQPSVVVPRRSAWFSWRPLTAAAAGIAFGMFCTSVVFAYAVPRMRVDRHRVVPLFIERFEDVKAVFGRGFPNDADGWSGDFDEVVSTDGAISPKEGQHMARLAPIAGRKFCAAERIVDLAKFPLISGTESRMVEVTASFHGMDSEWADRNQIRLAAFAEAPTNVKAIWNSDGRLDQVLQHLGRTVTMKPGEHGWQTLKVSMEIPTGARSLVIHLGAGVADDVGPKTLHYIDDVRAQFVITETTP